MQTVDHASGPPASRPLRWAGFLLGFSLGGFFDGILLHQVLQWHHLLSNVQAAALQDIRAQMLADGLFHVLMYFVAAWALWLLWKARAAYSAPGADRVLWAQALIGFGAWHIVDSVFSHWITGIHRIRVDSPNPLFWDLLWFFVFGVVPLVMGWLLHRSSGSDGGRTAPAALALAALVAAPLAALPAGETDQIVVMFRPGMEGAPAFNALARLTRACCGSTDPRPLGGLHAGVLACQRALCTRCAAGEQFRPGHGLLRLVTAFDLRG